MHINSHREYAKAQAVHNQRPYLIHGWIDESTGEKHIKVCVDFPLNRKVIKQHEETIFEKVNP